MQNSEMNYQSLDKKLQVGIALADRYRKNVNVSAFNVGAGKAFSQAALKENRPRRGRKGCKECNCKKGSSLGSFGQADIMAQLQSGEFLPNDFYGWSTKTILAALAIMLLLKLKKAQK